MPKDVHIITYVDPEFRNDELLARILKRVMYNYATARGIHFKNQFIFQVNTYDQNCRNVIQVASSIGSRIHVNLKPYNCGDDVSFNMKYGRTYFKMCKRAITYGYKSMILIVRRSTISEDYEEFKRLDNLIRLSYEHGFPTFEYIYDRPSMSSMLCCGTKDNIGEKLSKIPEELTSMVNDEDFDNMSEYEEYMFEYN